MHQAESLSRTRLLSATWTDIYQAMEAARDDLLIVDDPVPSSDSLPFMEQIISTLEDAEQERPGITETFTENWKEVLAHREKVDNALAQRAIRE